MPKKGSQMSRHVAGTAALPVKTNKAATDKAAKCIPPLVLPAVRKHKSHSNRGTTGQSIAATVSLNKDKPPICFYQDTSFLRCIFFIIGNNLRYTVIHFIS